MCLKGNLLILNKIWWLELSKRIQYWMRHRLSVCWCLGTGHFSFDYLSDHVRTLLCGSGAIGPSSLRMQSSNLSLMVASGSRMNLWSGALELPFWIFLLWTCRQIKRGPRHKHPEWNKNIVHWRRAKKAYKAVCAESPNQVAARKYAIWFLSWCCLVVAQFICMYFLAPGGAYRHYAWHLCFESSFCLQERDCIQNIPLISKGLRWRSISSQHPSVDR